MTENPVPKPVEQNVEERQTVQEFNDPLSQEASTRVISRSTQVTAPDKSVNILGILGFILVVLHILCKPFFHF